MSRDVNNELEELRKRVETLELHNKVLKRSIAQLKAQVRGESIGLARTLQQRDAEINSERNTTSNQSTAASSTVHDNFLMPLEAQFDWARKNIFLDEKGKRLDIGDRVYIVTKGAHTNRSRRGTVSVFDPYCNRVIVLDTTGVEQERAPKNLRKEYR